MTSPSSPLDPALSARLDALLAEGAELFQRFDRDVRQQSFHPFMPADYRRMLKALAGAYADGLRFLEWGSATGVITIMADFLGFEAYGVEIDPDLVNIARDLAARFDSLATFATGSFLPDGYVWVSESGDPRLGTIAEGSPAYGELGLELDAFDLVYAYPWGGEEPIMHDIMRRCGRPGARLMLHDTHGVRIYRDGVLQA